MTKRLWLTISFVILTMLSAGYRSQAAEAPKTVLVFYTEERVRPGMVIIDQAIRSAFQRGPIKVQIYNEYLDDVRISTDSYERGLISYLRDKYDDQKIDLIIPIGSPAMRMLVKNRDALFPGVPIVFGITQRGNLDTSTLGTNITGVTSKFRWGSTLDLALNLQPDTRQVVVVAGDSDTDRRFLAEARSEFNDRPGVEFTYLIGFTLEELRKQLANLPNHTIVLYTTVSSYGAGNYVSPLESLSQFAPYSAAPIYGCIEAMLGLGIVGGRLQSQEALATQTAQVGLRVLAGDNPNAIPVEMLQNTPMFDWRELRRWGISEKSLPPGSIVRFQTPTVWDLYKWRIIGVISLVVLQSILIAGLLIQRTRRKRAEDGRSRAEIDSLESRARLAGVIESARDAIVAVDQDERVVLFNEAAEKMFGCSAAKALGRSIERFIPDWLHGPSGDQVHLILETTVTGGIIGSISAFYGLRIDGTEFPIEASISELEVSGQRLRTFILRDITERRQAEQGLQESESRFRKMADTAPVLIWTADTNKLCNYFNKQWLEFTGRTLEQELGNGWAEGVHVEDYQRCLDTYVSSFDNRRSFHMEYRLRRNDGEYRWMVDTGVPRLTPDGTFSGYIGSCIDITERKLGDEELIRARAEMARVARVLTTGEMAAAIAHEVRQPLASMVANAEAASRMLEDDAIDIDESRKAIHDIVKDALRASQIVGHVRSLFQNAAHRTEPLIMNDIIDEVATIVRNDFVTRGVSMTTEMAADLPKVEADRVEMQQVVLNLMTNAMDAMVRVEEGGRNLLIRTSRDADGDVLLEFKDSGVGIPSENLDRIFDAFFTTRLEGMGMGLSICRTIIEAHGGRLWAESNTDKGATFRLRLPCSIGAIS